MGASDRYIEGVPCWADSSHPDPNAAKDFYRSLFGWDFVESGTSDQPYHIARLDGGDVGAISGGSPDSGTAQWNTYIWVDDIERTAEEVTANGGTVVLEPSEAGTDGTMAAVTDPEGAGFRLWQARDHRGSQKINEPGSVVFNDLYVQDIERAKSFYGAVFGWTTFGFDGGDSFWALPAYADHLETLNPGFKAGFAEIGMEGFTEVVASLNQISDDANEPPHWAVTFAVDDADAAAARVVELGGTLVVEPFDAPWIRATVVSDPQGATFTASQYKPETGEI